MQAGRLDADAAYGVGTVTNGSRWSSAVDRQTGATGADMGDAHPSTGRRREPGGRAAATLLTGAVQALPGAAAAAPPC